ncbi:LysR family transcriptional regulator [Chelatococcus reniformis]|uniref:LysR family transcriptional regulator n=1 Tax=Chelatococcus reniformis TaxID=1494448 RepID=A0A916UVC9_9HYPH|nr:LysR family transcriptional regulator [Chelatococcus reniformis]GGC88863.1 LysR family transcriptional regulator [Chelatococcus reniformis]
MDTDSLRTFLAIHRTGGFSSAAERLGRSQPAISRRIALLEEELGAPLFDRAAGGVVLSQAGHVLLPLAQRALAAIEDCRAAVVALRAGQTGPLALAAVGTLAGAGLTPALRRFSQAHAGVALTLRTAASSEVSELVRSGEATIGLRYHRDRSGDLDCLELAGERLLIACAADHPLAGRTVPSLASLADEHWLAFPPTGRAREAVADSLSALFLAHGVADLRWSAVDSLTAQKRLAEAGYGLAMLPGGAIDEERAAGSLAVIDVAGLTLANPVYVVTRRQGYLSPAATALIALLRETSGDPPRPPSD